MMARERRPLVRPQLLALLVLLLGLGGALYWAYGPQAPTGAPGPSSNGQATTGGGGALPRPQPLELAKLEPVPAAAVSTRDPFHFGVPPAPPAPPRVAPPPVAPPVINPAPVASSRPPIPLKFLGTKDSAVLGKLAVLGDGKGGVFLGREGEVVDGQYRIVKIGLDSIVMEYVDGEGRRTLREGGM